MNTDRSSEGPYQRERWEVPNESAITGPGWDRFPGVFTDKEANRIVPLLNIAYHEGREAAEKKIPQLLEAAHADGFNEGRKAMEKDFQELLHIANKWSKFPLDSSDEFDAWKKARGIE